GLADVSSTQRIEVFHPTREIQNVSLSAAAEAFPDATLKMSREGSASPLPLMSRERALAMMLNHVRCIDCDTVVNQDLTKVELLTKLFEVYPCHKRAPARRALNVNE